MHWQRITFWGTPCSLLRLYFCMQVETIGDAYMVVCGAPERIQSHADHVADMALSMIEAVVTKKDPSGLNDYIKIRIGL